MKYQSFYTVCKTLNHVEKAFICVKKHCFINLSERSLTSFTFYSPFNKHSSKVQKV